MPLLKINIDGKYLNDPLRVIPQAHLEVVCRRSHGAKACRYICSVGLPEDGVFVCVKNTPMKADIDKVSTTAGWRAKGDNCDGFGEKPSEEKQQKGNEKGDCKASGDQKGHPPKA